jgi:hypothetical protein
MAGRQRRELPADLTRGARRFVEWRRSRILGERIPEALWNQAVDLASRYGVSRTATALSVGFHELQKRAARQTTSDKETRAAATAFVELPAAPAVGECIIECENASGWKMRVELKGTSWPDLVALSRSFWDAG